MGDEGIGIGSRRGYLSYFPPTPPDMRVRIRRFGELRFMRARVEVPRATRSTDPAGQFAALCVPPHATSFGHTERPSGVPRHRLRGAATLDTSFGRASV